MNLHDRSARALATAALLLFAPHLLADQTDARLDELFAALHASEAGLNVRAVEREIWSIWNASGDAAIDELMNEAGLARSAEHLDEAIALYDRIVAAKPDFAEGWNARATAHYLRGDLARALEDVERTLALEPRHYGAIFGRALIEADQGAYDAALESLDEVLEANPHARGIDLLRENIRQRQGN